MSGLTKKQVYVDRNLSAVLGAREGEILSYAEIQKGLHKYIKENDLKNLQHRPKPAASQPSVQPEIRAGEPVSQSMKRCRDCDEEIPAEALFCDLCGVRQ